MNAGDRDRTGKSQNLEMPVFAEFIEQPLFYRFHNIGHNVDTYDCPHFFSIIATNKKASQMTRLIVISWIKDQIF